MIHTNQALVSRYIGLLNNKETAQPVQLEKPAALTQATIDTIERAVIASNQKLYFGDSEYLKKYKSHSEADFALARLIVHKGNAYSMHRAVLQTLTEEVFKRSSLYRPEKWKTVKKNTIPKQIDALFQSLGQADSGQSLNDQDPESGNTRLELLQKKYVILELGGKFCMTPRPSHASADDVSPAGNVPIYTGGDIKTALMRALRQAGFSEDTSLVAKFMHHPSTQMFRGLEFHPRPRNKLALNTWVGPTAVPCEGDPSIIIQYLETVICDGDKASSEYLLDYLAHMLQRPEEKPGIMIVLLGGQGTGKGTFYSLLRSIWRRTTLMVQDVEQIVGRFNASLECNYVIFLDEALFRGNKSGTEKLKSVTTEPTIHIEQKHQPTRTIESVHRLFAATNQLHFGHVDRDDRRYLFLRLSSHRAQDTAYFASVHWAIEDQGTLGAFVRHLYQRDLSSRNIRLRPLTPEHQNQRLHSLEEFDRTWFDMLHEEKIKRDGGFVSTEGLLNYHKEISPKRNYYDTVQANVLAARIKLLCPSAKPTRQSYGEDASKRGYDLPPLEVCRAEFESFLGFPIPWNDPAGRKPKFDSPF